MTTYQSASPLKHRSLAVTNRLADFYVRNVQRGHMLIDPPYQRGDVWTVGQRMGLVRSWLEGVPVPAVIVNDRTTPQWLRARLEVEDALAIAYAVVDGRQRIQTAIDWMTGGLLVPASWFPASHIARATDTADGPYVRFTDLTEVGERFAEDYCVIPCCTARVETVEKEAELYLLVNGAGTPQTDADMGNAARIAEGR